MATPADHPAPFSTEVMDQLRVLIKDWDGPIYDPYAGVFRIHLLDRDDTWGTEIEQEYVDKSMVPERSFCLDSRFVGELIVKGLMPQPKAVVTSPDYGNRFADQYLGTPAERDLRERTGQKPRRRSYAISLNRRVSEGSGAAHQWGPDYRRVHEAVMDSVSRVLEPGAKMALNISDHYRGTKRQDVTSWWVGMVGRCGWRVTEMVPVETRRFKDGENSDLRVENEWIVVATLTNMEDQ